MRLKTGVSASLNDRSVFSLDSNFDALFPCTEWPLSVPTNAITVL